MKMMFLLFSSLLIPPLWALPNGEPQTFDEDQERTTSQIVLTARGGRLPDPGGFAAGRVSSSGRRYNVPEYPSLIGGSPPDTTGRGPLPATISMTQPVKGTAMWCQDTTSSLSPRSSVANFLRPELLLSSAAKARSCCPRGRESRQRPR